MLGRIFPSAGQGDDGLWYYASLAVTAGSILLPGRWYVVAAGTAMDAVELAHAARAFSEGDFVPAGEWIFVHYATEWLGEEIGFPQPE